MAPLSCSIHDPNQTPWKHRCRSSDLFNRAAAQEEDQLFKACEEEEEEIVMRECSVYSIVGQNKGFVEFAHKP
ncbi:hypothetical protein SUGI_0108370 [Cryptomeria japonica]|nr:hypothetical protein SUGI_0108370 [Cryptomeria japonica]